MNALAELIFASRSRRGSRNGVSGGGSVLSDADLLTSASDLLAQVRAAADSPSPTILVELPLSTDLTAWLLAAIYGDLSICIVDPAASPAHRTAVRAALEPHVTIDSTGVRACPAQDEPGRSTRVGPARPGYVAMSSGSTGGGPKGVLSPWASIAEFVAHGAAAFELDHAGAWAECTHPAYDMAMTNLLVAMASGADIHLSGSLGDRLRPLRHANRVGATHLRTAPRFIDLAVAEGRTAPSSLRMWGCGGDRLLTSQVKQLFELGVPVVANTYGTSETIGFASVGRLLAGEDVPSLHGTATIGTGHVGPWHAELVSSVEATAGPDSTNTLGVASMLAIESPFLPSGYLFGAATSDYPRWEPGRVLTGDLGSWVSKSLFCLGRAGRRVKRNGLFVNLDDVDERIRALSGRVSFTVLTEEGVLLSLVEDGPAGNDLRRDLASELTPDLVPDLVVPMQSLPRLANGKIDQASAVAAARDHEG